MLLKKGSNGEDVKKVQTKVGVKADGAFGAMTEIAVKQWQAANGLKADGIVGNATWAKMFGNDKCVDASVIYDPLSVHITKLEGRQIKYIAIHYTASSRSTKGVAKNIKGVFESRSASADFCVDDEEMRQFNPDLRNYYCWAVGDKKYTSTGGGQLYGVATNKNTISIELCSTCTPKTSDALNTGNHSGWSFTDAVLENAIKLTKILMAKYGIDKDHVVRHYDISGKLCPAIIGWNDAPLYDIVGNKIGVKNNSSKWKWFKERL